MLSADGCGTAEIMRRAGVSKTAVWRWQACFMTESVNGLLHDKTRPSHMPPLAAEVADEVVRRTLGTPDRETTHRTVPALSARAHRCRPAGKQVDLRVNPRCPPCSR